MKCILITYYPDYRRYKFDYDHWNSDDNTEFRDGDNTFGPSFSYMLIL